MNSSYKAVTVFDLDETLVSCNTSADFGKFLYKKKFFETRTALFLCVLYTLYKLKLLSVNRLHYLCYFRIFRNTKAEEVHRLVDEYLTENLESILNQQIVEKLRQANQSGHYTVLLSSSPCFLVSKIAGKVGVKAHLGTRYYPFRRANVVDGSTKAYYIKQLSLRKNISMKDITVYSDHSLDLPLMKIVGNPIAVSPDLKLRLYSLIHGWKIV